MRLDITEFERKYTGLTVNLIMMLFSIMGAISVWVYDPQDFEATFSQQNYRFSLTLAELLVITFGLGTLLCYLRLKRGGEQLMFGIHLTCVLFGGVFWLAHMAGRVSDVSLAIIEIVLVLIATLAWDYKRDGRWFFAGLTINLLGTISSAGITFAIWKVISMVLPI